MRLIIHAGMHKTGASSIQKTFHQLERPGLCYAPWRVANHSALFSLLTSRSPEAHQSFARQRLTREEVGKLFEKWNGAFQEFLAARHTIKIMSGEAMSNGWAAQVQRLADIVRPYSHRTDVLIYIRPPISFMTSAFQQRLKGGESSQFGLEKLWPNYRRRVEPLDSAFGRDNVTVRAYHPWEFSGGDVVRDFARFAGVVLDAHEVQVKNEMLSAEATALIFLQRRMGHGLEKPGHGTVDRNVRWAERLAAVGGRQLSFGDSLVGPVLDANSEDLHWIEDRLGCKLRDRGPGFGEHVEVTCDEDLLDLANEQRDRVAELLADRVDNVDIEPRRRRLIQMLEALRAMS